MNKQIYDIGLIGLAVMGQNLVLNMERTGYSVGVYNRTTARTETFMEKEAEGKEICAANTVAELVELLKQPRAVMLMVKAGWPVGAVIEELIPLLDPGDLIIDGGNSFYKDTERRAETLEDEGMSSLARGSQEASTVRSTARALCRADSWRRTSVSSPFSLISRPR
jgi:6-phosphogluconate dehydrogenase